MPYSLYSARDKWWKYESFIYIIRSYFFLQTTKIKCTLKQQTGEFGVVNIHRTKYDDFLCILFLHLHMRIHRNIHSEAKRSFYRKQRWKISKEMNLNLNVIFGLLTISFFFIFIYMSVILGRAYQIEMQIKLISIRMFPLLLLFHVEMKIYFFKKN